MDEKEMATIDDWLSLSSVCIWEGSTLGAEIFHLSNAPVNLAGRSSDIADSCIKDVMTVRKEKGLITYRYLCQIVNRFKTSTINTHQIALHCNLFLLWFYFSMVYLVVMCDELSRQVNFLPHLQESYSTRINKWSQESQLISTRSLTYFGRWCLTILKLSPCVCCIWVEACIPITNVVLQSFCW